jgi:hypothetical protein
LIDKIIYYIQKSNINDKVLINFVKNLKEKVEKFYSDLTELFFIANKT